MYEKHGLMSKLTNPTVLAYLREQKDKKNIELVENALRLKLGIPPKRYSARNHKINKKIGCDNAMPVKVFDPDLVAHILNQKNRYGISYRFTIESAILNMIGSNQ